MYRALERPEVMTKTLSLGALLLAAALTPAAADTPANPMTQLDPIVGTWKVAGTMTMGKDAVKITATWTCKRVSAKAGILCTLDMKGIPGLGAYAETDLFGFDPNSNTLHWFAVTNGGETHDHVAKVGEGGKLQFVYTGTQEGKPFKEVIDTEIGKGGTSISIRSESFVAGASVAVLEGKGKK
jgi:hypothetical protein